MDERIALKSSIEGSNLLYSHRSATAASTRIAFDEGSKQATGPTTANSTAAPRNVSGSTARTPKSRMADVSRPEHVMFVMKDGRPIDSIVGVQSKS